MPGIILRISLIKLHYGHPRPTNDWPSRRSHFRGLLLELKDRDVEDHFQIRLKNNGRALFLPSRNKRAFVFPIEDGLVFLNNRGALAFPVEE